MRLVTGSLFLLIIGILSACGFSESTSLEPTSELVIQSESANPTEPSQPIQPITPSQSSATPAQSIGGESPISATPKPTAEIMTESQDVLNEEEKVTSYQVAFVEEGDVLNVRIEPGANSDIVGQLEPGESGIEVIGGGQEIRGSVWSPIRAGDVEGWVNSQYLVERVTSDSFCDEDEVKTFLDEFQLAISEQDGERLSELVAQDRGVRFRRHWWNPEVFIAQEDVAELFTSQTSYDWGLADGSGEPITGTFMEVIQPLLDRNLLGASEMACNEILHGGTAGLVILPFEYEGLNYYSLHRPPGPNDIELDWGSWVIGVEKWQGDYYLSYLVHYEWEI